MKRFLVIPIMVLYLLAMSGVMVHAHYCGDTLESWSVYLQGDGCEEDGCSDEPQEEDGCCKDKVVASKVTQDQNHVDAYKLKTSLAELNAILPGRVGDVIEAPIVCQATIVTNQSNAPPGLWEGIPLYKLHSSFTYYG